MSNPFVWKWKEGSQGSTGSSNLVGNNTTWSPRRSYTCTFCRRVFQSAQALGGHMNIHRRERARLQLQQRQRSSSTSSTTTTTTTSIFFPFASQNNIVPILGQPFLGKPVVKGLELGSDGGHRELLGVPKAPKDGGGGGGICIQEKKKDSKTSSLNDNNNNVQVLDLELRLWW